MKKKSNIESKAFYAEADDMQEGWGKYLRSIDVLKDKVQFNKEITLKEYCWTLYGDYYTSHCWGAFQKYGEKILKLTKKKMIYDAWSGIFSKWHKELYDINKNY